METSKVLLVDDDPGLLRVCRWRLEKAGYSVETADRIDRALEVAGSERFYAIVCDVVLDRMTGFEAVEQFRKKTSAPVVLISGAADEEMAKDAAVLGAAGLVPKTDEFAQLLEILQRLRTEPSLKS